MFTRLFKPRWEHSDPGIRRQAFESGEAPADALARAACEDRDTDVRRCAVQRLSDLNLIDTLLATELPGDIHAAAERRRHELLSGPPQSDPPLAARLESLARLSTPGLCAALAREAQAAEIRSAALDQIIDIEILCTVAIDDPVAAVRRTACERIDDPQGWEMVAREARNKDKQVSRLARDRLDAYRKRLEDQQAAERLCDEIEALAEIPVDSDVRRQLLRLNNHWEQLETPPPDQLVERFSRARERLAKGIERFNALLGQRQTLCADLKNLWDNLRETVDIETVNVAELQERLQQASARWQALTRDAGDDEALAQQLADLDRQLRFILERAATDQARRVPLRALVQRAEALLAADGDLDEHHITDLQRRWKKLAAPVSPVLAKALEQEFAACCNQMRERLKRQDARRREALKEADSLIEGLEDVLREGKLERALSQRDRARHLLKVAAGVDERRRAALQARLQHLHPRLEQLRQWRHWGSGNARERLCAELEALAGGVLPAAELATRVRTARDDWKRIDHGEGPAPEALWQRFDRACTQAYAPYQQERREQAERLSAHLTRKQALIDELDAFERNTDWKTVDWRAADRTLRSAVDRWRRIGAVPSRSRKIVEKDYRAVLARLESHLESERERELRRRRALIARVEQLAATDDLHAAIRETREAQEAWSPSVQADREQEQQLWRTFRKACDAVFGKAKREREAADSDRQANLDRKNALCAELEALLDDPQKAYPELAQRFAAVAAEWNGIGEIPRQKTRDVESRYERLGKQLAKRRQQELRSAEQALLKGARERAQLCERLETAVLENTLAEAERPVLLEEIRQAWERLTPLDAPQEVRLRQRFEQAALAFSGNGAARKAVIDDLPRNLERRQELCLEMEIAAGLDSPEQFSDARLRLQVSRLADALGHRQGGATDTAGRLRELLLDWYLTGPVAMEMRGELDARIDRVLAVVE